MRGLTEPQLLGGGGLKEGVAGKGRGDFNYFQGELQFSHTKNKLNLKYIY